jgi:hypothetical protein
MVHVSLSVKLPKSANRRDVEKWLQYQFGYTGGLDGGNPLVEHDAEAKTISVKF